MPTVAEIASSRHRFLELEPRHLFYKVATELIDLSLKGVTHISLAEALAVLLQTWNRAYYQYRGFDEAHFQDIERLVSSTGTAALRFRDRDILSFEKADEDLVRIIFAKFVEVLGPVGAAKSLHLLAPNFFPLWDRAIAKKYGINLDYCPFDGYANFMQTVRRQASALRDAGAPWLDVLKALDEYNYCTFTLKTSAESV